MYTLCEFEYHWHFNHTPEDVQKKIDTIQLNSMTPEECEAQIRNAIEEDRRFNKGSTIVYTDIRFK